MFFNAEFDHNKQRYLSILSVPDEGYSRNVLCALYLISTFLQKALHIHVVEESNKFYEKCKDFFPPQKYSLSDLHVLYGYTSLFILIVSGHIKNITFHITIFKIKKIYTVVQNVVYKQHKCKGRTHSNLCCCEKQILQL